MTPAGRRSLVLGPLLVALLTAGGSAPTAGAGGDSPAGGVPTGVAGSASGSPGVGDTYYPLDGNGGVDVQRYDIRTRYDLESARLSGTTLVTMTATQDLSRFNLDFLLPVSEVRVDGVRADHRRERGHELVISPRRAIPAGRTVRVEVTYAGSPAQRSYEGQRNWLANRHEVVTMNEPHMAAWWFPANDHPSDKAGFRISVTVPSGHQAIANGVLVDRRRRGGHTTWTWASPEPMASYLAYFAAGRFKLAHGESDGRPWTVAVSTMLLPRDRRNSMRLLRTTPALVSWLESELGTYPFGSTGGLVTSLNPGFALENQTRPVYPTLYPGATWLLVHELAHQWFGNSVSVARWRDIWLNEGAATFMEKRYHEVHHGRPAQEWLVEQHGLRREADPFWRVRIGDPGKGKLFDAAVYDRGGMALQALRHRVGEDAFWAILRGWLAERADGNVTSPEFEAYAEQVSGQDLDGFFQAWLYTPARPARTAENGLL